MSDTLYARLGGYDAIAAVADDLLVRLRADAQLARFWQHRAEDSIRREKQLLINFLCASAGGRLYYIGRDMKLSHQVWGSPRATGSDSSATSRRRSTISRCPRRNGLRSWDLSTARKPTSSNSPSPRAHAEADGPASR